MRQDVHLKSRQIVMMDDTFESLRAFTNKVADNGILRLCLDRCGHVGVEIRFAHP